MVYRDNKKADSPEELEDDKDSGNQTTLIPKSLVAGFDVKPGDEIRIKVLHSFDDELEIEYVHKDKKDDKDDNKTEDPKSEDMDSANSELDSLAAQGQS